jgi:hypothetical protein
VVVVTGVKIMAGKTIADNAKTNEVLPIQT